MDTNNTTPNPNEQPVVNNTVTPETPVAPAPALEPESETKYEGVLANYKEGINPPTSTPVATTSTSTTTTTETPVIPTPVAPVAPIAPTAPDYSNPEIAKQKLQEILNTPTGETSMENQGPTGVPAQKPKTSILRILFLVVLIIFLGVIAAVAYYMIKGNSTTTTATPTVAPVVTEAPVTQPETTVCTLNDQQYQIGETFAAADGCNVCSCAADLTITCTERVCAPTVAPTEVATSTPTKATTVTPSKTATASPTKITTPTKIATPTK